MSHLVMSEDSSLRDLSPLEVMHCMQETGCRKLGSSADAMVVLPQLCQLQGLGAHTARRQRWLSNGLKHRRSRSYRVPVRPSLFTIFLIDETVTVLSPCLQNGDHNGICLSRAKEMRQLI